jgi:hypothetical protein
MSLPLAATGEKRHGDVLINPTGQLAAGVRALCQYIEDGQEQLRHSEGRSAVGRDCADQRIGDDPLPQQSVAMLPLTPEPLASAEIRSASDCLLCLTSSMICFRARKAPRGNLIPRLRISGSQAAALGRNVTVTCGCVGTME